jgi:2-dehydro-3-deoxyphosphogluconate aldolase/(4S)-4-hydroxy-2-oxoglutarate aldolase
MATKVKSKGTALLMSISAVYTAIPMLKSIGGPLPQVTFCPTGGVNPKNAPDYLSLSNVACVGGSWMAPAELVDAGDWAEITRRAAVAAALKK